MNLGAVIQQIRQYVPALNSNVAGAAEFADALERTVDLPMPAAYVIPLDDDADDNNSQTGLRQFVRQRIGVIVETSASADRRGQAAALTVDGMTYALHSALLNWRIDPVRAQKGLQYNGGRLLHFDRARIFWQYEYELIVTISDEDGFQPDAVPLSGITMDVGINGDVINAAFDVTRVSASVTLSKPVVTATMAQMSVSLDMNPLSAFTAASVT